MLLKLQNIFPKHIEYCISVIIIITYHPQITRNIKLSLRIEAAKRNNHFVYLLWHKMYFVIRAFA